MKFEHFNVQAGIDGTGVQTDMLTLNSTVKIFYRNPATFFGVHVTATPIELYYYKLKIASGHMKKFYQPRKSKRVLVAVVEGNQIPVYGAVPILNDAKDHSDGVSVPLNLTFVISGNEEYAKKHPHETQCPVHPPHRTIGLRFLNLKPHETWISKSDGQCDSSDETSKAGQEGNGDGNKEADEGEESPNEGSEPPGTFLLTLGGVDGFNVVEHGHSVDLEGAYGVNYNATTDEA
nr:uncharacterized protein LOC109161324 [Ipomoea trifida]